MAPLKVCAITTKYLLIGNSVGEHWGVGSEKNWGQSGSPVEMTWTIQPLPPTPPKHLLWPTGTAGLFCLLSPADT